ncbi:MAG: primosomal protein N' [Candidatus Thiodiazotropha sp.]
MESEPILQIVLAGPLRTAFDYLPPIRGECKPLPGCRFQVPFGRSSRIGLLIAINPDSSLPRKSLKRALRQLDPDPLLEAEDLRLLRWAADYYQHPLGDVIFHALPVTLRKDRPQQSSRPGGYRLTQQGRGIESQELRRAPKQQQIVQKLREQLSGMSTRQLLAETDSSTSVLRILKEKGWIETCPVNEDSPPIPPSQVERHCLNTQQQQAVDAVRDQLGRFQPFLLNGVTGSGKTEVYLHLVEAALQTGRQVLVLVPEIGLTPQLLQRFRNRLGDRVMALHSGLADGEREQVWQAMRTARQPVLIGTRSAVFCPLPKLGLIVVDEEHDLSFKQQEGFRYSARDLSLVRARQHSCPVVLGSATPSLESLRNAQEDRYRILRLAHRAAQSQMPKLQLVDVRNLTLNRGLSPVLIRELQQTLESGEQAMVFLNRRGYAPMLTCHVCGWLTDCPRCDARMTHHRQKNLLWCHHCGHQQRVPDQCPECASPDLRPMGQGTERVEEHLRELFPDTPLARIDRDTTRRKGSLEQILGEVRAGRYPLLLGTQMLAKGHHFPAVTLVAILDVDQGLFGADFRAGERMAQLILQVAGRAGRAQRPGRVLIQTRHPDHPLMQLLIHEGYDAFAAVALEERRQAQLPPFTHQVLIRAEANDPRYPEDFLHQVLASGASPQETSGIEFWGPVPAPMERRAGKTRAHLLVQSTQRSQLQRWLKGLAERVEQIPMSRRVRWSVDVDPQEMF